MAKKIFKKKKLIEKPAKPKFFTWQKILITATAVLIIVIAAFVIGMVKKECRNDACFKESLERCSTAKYLQLENYNYYQWVIDGKKGENCKMDVKLVRMAVGTPVDKIKLFEGKGMKCLVPLDVLKKTDSSKVENILNYCTGPLKEAVYQSIIERLYTVIIANLGSAIKELDKTIKSGVL